MTTLFLRSISPIVAIAICLIAQSQAVAQIDLEGFPSIKSFTKGGSLSISSSTVDGVKTTNILDNGRKTKIVESDEDGIAITLTKSYGPNDKDALKKDHPGIFMHLTSFPTQSDDGSEVELQINLKKTYRAENADELKKKHPEAFAAYKKYTDPNVGGVIRFGGAGPLRLDIPKFEIKRGDRILEITPRKKEEKKKEEKKKDPRFKDA